MPHRARVRVLCVPLGARKLLIGNVGDGEAVLCRGYQAVHMSPVHNPGRADENKRIIEANGWVTTEQVGAFLQEGRCCAAVKMDDWETIVGALSCATRHEILSLESSDGSAREVGVLFFLMSGCFGAWFGFWIYVQNCCCKR